MRCLGICVVLLGSGIGLLGCAVPSAADIEQFYARTALEFDTGRYHKPLLPENETLISRISPLIIQEVLGQEDPDVKKAGKWGHGVVYALEREVQVGGRRHLQLVYRWWHSSEPAQSEKPLGLCVTLDSSGHPVIWEVLDERSLVRVFYVSDSIEKAARHQYGEPLPGRRHSVEPPRDLHPEVVVARVLDDGPVPMGPMVYVKARPPVVSTVACRCMPAQVKAISDTHEYALLPFETGVAEGHTGVQELEVYLRLPAGF
jgi:hypothetical protein